MPSASVSTATAVKPGFLANIRRPYRKSCRSVPIASSSYPAVSLLIAKF
jgi:hypothetical protein